MGAAAERKASAEEARVVAEAREEREAMGEAQEGREGGVEREATEVAREGWADICHGTHSREYWQVGRMSTCYPGCH